MHHRDIRRPASSRLLRNTHFQLSRGGCGAALRCRPAPIAQGEGYLSGEIGIWMSPVMCLIGPADDGITSKSKISVGSHKVAQALGTSTTPEMWPCTGAVPRIE